MSISKSRKHWVYPLPATPLFVFPKVSLLTLPVTAQPKFDCRPTIQNSCFP